MSHHDEMLESILEERLARLEDCIAEAVKLLGHQQRALQTIEGHAYVASLALLHTALGNTTFPDTMGRARSIRDTRGKGESYV